MSRNLASAIGQLCWIIWPAVILSLGLPLTGKAGGTEDHLQSSGTGFAVTREGHLLTNHHVVEDCPSIRVTLNGKQKELAVLTKDKKNDLAIVKMPGPLPSAAKFRSGRSIRPGDSVVVVGFPYHSLLAAEAHVTTGTVSALAGIGNDVRILQFDASVQPGNSGGPLLDKSGHIVGIVESKLNSLGVALITGDIPQNVNFAIKDGVIKLFLESAGVNYELAPSDKQLEPADVAETAKRFTFLLECYSRPIDGGYSARLDSDRRALEEQRQALERERKAFDLRAQRENEARERTARAQQDAHTMATEASRSHQAESDLGESVAVERQGVPFKDDAREAMERARQKGKEARAQAQGQQDGESRTKRAEVQQDSLREDPAVVASARQKGKQAREEAMLRREEPLPIFTERAEQVVILADSHGSRATVKGQSRVQPNPYWDRVAAIISSGWEAPPSVSGSTIVSFRLYRNGMAKNIQISESSGNNYFDMSAHAAVLRPRAFPPFPAEMSEAYQDVEMVFSLE